MENGCLKEINDKSCYLLLGLDGRSLKNSCLLYHSKGDISGHLTKRYIPLLYLNPTGLLMYSARTFPVYITACIRDALVN